MRRNWLRKTGFGAAGLVGLALALGATGCKSNSNAPIVDSATTDATDPADVNMAPANGAAPVYQSTQQPARVLGQQSQGPAPQASGESYPDQQAGAYDQAYDQDQQAVDAGQQALYADQAPPPLPDYQQPELTEAGYEWTPGYWSYGPNGYYWVPGVWVAPPYVGALWTPGYWGWYSGRYRFHYGFWGSHIGFYGGINYGFGYTGSGYHGGYWQGNNFFYNRQVNRVNVSVVRNVYEHNVTVVNNTRVSFNGPQGVAARPSAADVAVYHERVVPAMHVQVQAAQAAAGNRQQSFAENHGRPAVAVANERLGADRTPPAAIRPAAEVRQPMQPVNAPRPGVVSQPVGNARPEPAQPIREPQGRPQPAAPQRQPEVSQPQRSTPAPIERAPQQQPQVRPVQQAPQPNRQAPQPNRQAPQPQREQRQAPPQPQQQARPQPEAHAAPAPQRPEARPAPAPQQQAAPHPVAHPEPPREEHPKG